MKLLKNIYFLYTIIIGLVVILLNQWAIVDEVIKDYNDYQNSVVAQHIPQVVPDEVKAPPALYFEGVYCLNQIGFFEYIIFQPNFRATVYSPSLSGPVNRLEMRYAINREKREVDVQFFDGVLRDGTKLEQKFSETFKILSWNIDQKITLMAGWHGVISDNCQYTKVIERIVENYPNKWKEFMLQLTRRQLDAMQGAIPSFQDPEKDETKPSEVSK